MTQALSLQDKVEPRVPFELRWPKATSPNKKTCIKIVNTSNDKASTNPTRQNRNTCSIWTKVAFVHILQIMRLAWGYINMKWKCQHATFKATFSVNQTCMRACIIWDNKANNKPHAFSEKSHYFESVAFDHLNLKETRASVFLVHRVLTLSSQTVLSLHKSWFLQKAVFGHLNTS